MCLMPFLLMKCLNSALVKLGTLLVTHICCNPWVAKIIRKTSTVGFVPLLFEFKGITSIHLENDSTNSKNTLPKMDPQNQAVLKSKDPTPSPSDGWVLSSAYFDFVDMMCSLLLRFQLIFQDLVTICGFWLRSSF